MCAICGCSDHPAGHEHDHPHGHGHDHDHPHGHGHDHPHGHGHDHPHDHRAGEHAHPSAGELVRLERDLLRKNDRAAAENRRWLAARDVVALNLLSSPGAGKTTLLERTIRDLGAELHLGVIEGDQATENDADRIRAAGAPAVQINTGTGCHLDADMVARGLAALGPRPRSVVMIENVGNLVCPALFDLGEHAKVVVASVTEGDDKPLKYPYLFREATLLLLNKVDLLPHVRFDVERFSAAARQVNPGVHTLLVSATRGDALEGWYAWLRRRAATAGAHLPHAVEVAR